MFVLLDYSRIVSIDYVVGLVSLVILFFSSSISVSEHPAALIVSEGIATMLF